MPENEVFGQAGGGQHSVKQDRNDTILRPGLH